jgi:hypothetical protein
MLKEKEKRILRDIVSKLPALKDDERVLIDKLLCNA